MFNVDSIWYLVDVLVYKKEKNRREGRKSKKENERGRRGKRVVKRQRKKERQIREKG